MAKAETIRQILAEITVLYPQMFSPTAEQTAIWSLYLRDLEDELLVNALRRYVSTAKDNYPPSVPALRRCASELKREAAGVPTAYEAWQELKRMGDGSPLSRITGEKTAEGRYIIVDVPRAFCHPLVEEVARRLGWPSFPNSSEEEIDRAHFFKAYESALGKLLEADRDLPEVREFVDERKRLRG
jgi:hypothetical protein